jgi:hypothetical protein
MDNKYDKMDIKRVKVVSKNHISFYDPFKLTGTEGFLNYKMSGFNSHKINNSGGSKNGGGFVTIIMIIIVFILLKACGE